MAKWEYRYHRQTVLYEALTARVGHRDALLWQSPALAMTAQAFLLTIALGHESRPIARIIAATLGLFVTRMSIQLMRKHNLYLINDQIMMVSLEREMGLPSSAIDHEMQLRRLKADRSEPPLRKYEEKEGPTAKVSVDVWINGLHIFAWANAAILAFAVAEFFGVPCWQLPDISGNVKCYVSL